MITFVKRLKPNTMKHTFMILYPTHKIWVTLLTSVNPKLKEYRFTYSDGVVRYITQSEIKNSPLFEAYFGVSPSFLLGQLDLLTDAIDENKIGLHNGELYTK